MIQIISPMPMQWEESFSKTFSDSMMTKEPIVIHPDVMLHMWCDRNTIEAIENHPDIKHVVFIRRYEMYAPWVKKLDVSKVSKVIMVNDFLADKFMKMFHVKPEVIYNGVDLSKWTYRERTHGSKIAMVGYVHPKKGHQMALQIMKDLPDGYELHIAGGVQDECLLDYLIDFIQRNGLNVSFHGQIPHDQMDEWLDDKNYILSCAYSEGCPNNVLEAMAKGIKPIIHSWPGAEEQFGENVFDTVKRATNMIICHPYDSRIYRSIVAQRFSDDVFKKIKEVIDGL